MLRAALALVALPLLPGACHDSRALLIAEVTADPALPGVREVTIQIGTSRQTFDGIEGLAPTSPVRLGLFLRDVPASAVRVAASARTGNPCFSYEDAKDVELVAGEQAVVALALR